MYTCTRPCARPFTGGPNGREHSHICVDGRVYGPYGPYTAVYKPCKRLVQAVYGGLRPVHGHVHGQVHVCRSSSCVHGRVYGRTAVHTGRIHVKRVVYTTVYTAMYTGRGRVGPCTRPPCTRPVRRTWPGTRPCTLRVYGREFGMCTRLHGSVYITRPCTRAVSTDGSRHGPCTRRCGVHCVRAVYTVVYTCTRPCLRPVYTAVYARCTRALLSLPLLLAYFYLNIVC